MLQIQSFRVKVGEDGGIGTQIMEHESSREFVIDQLIEMLRAHNFEVSAEDFVFDDGDLFCHVRDADGFGAGISSRYCTVRLELHLLCAEWGVVAKARERGLRLIDNGE